MAGAIKTLVVGLQAQTAGSGVLVGYRVVFGEENVVEQGDAGVINVVPADGTFDRQGMMKRPQRQITEPSNPLNPKLIHTLDERIELRCWARHANPDAVQPQLDHADAAETLRVKALQALKTQQWGTYYYRPLTSKWEQADGEVARLGRAVVLLIAVEIPVTMPEAVEQQVISVPLTPVINPFAGG